MDPKRHRHHVASLQSATQESWLQLVCPANLSARLFSCNSFEQVQNFQVATCQLAHSKRDGDHHKCTYPSPMQNRTRKCFPISVMNMTSGHARNSRFGTLFFQSTLPFPPPLAFTFNHPLILRRLGIPALPSSPAFSPTVFTFWFCATPSCGMMPMHGTTRLLYR